MNKCGRTAEVIEDPMAALDVCVSTEWVRILTCGCTYLRVLIIIFFELHPHSTSGSTLLGGRPLVMRRRKTPRLGHNAGQN